MDRFLAKNWLSQIPDPHVSQGVNKWGGAPRVHGHYGGDKPNIKGWGWPLSVHGGTPIRAPGGTTIFEYSGPWRSWPQKVGGATFAIRSDQILVVGKTVKVPDTGVRGTPITQVPPHGPWGAGT